MSTTQTEPTLIEAFDLAVSMQGRTPVTVHWRWFDEPYWADVRSRVEHLDRVEATRLIRIAAAVARADRDTNRW